MPVRERLLLVLPGKEIYDYLCTGCAESLGQREVQQGPRRDKPSGLIIVALSAARGRPCALFFLALEPSEFPR